MVRNTALFATILLVTACKVPIDVPNKIAHQRGAALPELERPDYIKGFLEGSAMVEAARKNRLRPVHPVLSVPNEDELDPHSGLVIWNLSENAKSVHTVGMVDGFDWALKSGQAIALPNPRPDLPQAKEFQTWSGEFKNLHSGALSITLEKMLTVLIWTDRNSGFEPHRGWRDISGIGEPKAIALEGGTLWVAGENAVWALDLETASIRREMAPLKWTPQDTTSSDVGGDVLDVKKAAENGDTQAMLIIGASLEDGGDYAGAMTWYQRAADKNSAKGMEHIAFLYALGRGVPKDRQKARSWLVRAKDAGDPDASSLLGALDHPEKVSSH